MDYIWLVPVKYMEDGMTGRVGKLNWFGFKKLKRIKFSDT